MSLPEINNCPGTLAPGYTTYSKACLNRMFNGKKVHHVMPYNSPASNEETDKLFTDNVTRISISGVQEKFSVQLEKNKLRLIHESERGSYILKPIPATGKQADQMPANEHLTMQIARQVYGIATAENALIFFHDGQPAYITRRFDVNEENGKWAKEDFASLAGRTPQTHGEHYKYLGNYLQLFELMQRHLPAYKPESLKLFKLLVFNYLFSNGDAHFKNFSLLETPLGDFRLSPAYDLLNSRMHIDDTDFALDDGLLPKSIAKGKIKDQFYILGEAAKISRKQIDLIFKSMLSDKEKVESLIGASFLNDKAKRHYLQSWQARFNKLERL